MAAVALSLAFMPQLAAWRYLYGTWWANAYGYQATLLALNFFQVFFGRRHGVFFWHPWLLIALCELVVGLKHFPRLFGSLLGVILGPGWVYGNWRIYWLGVSFGMRGFVDVLPPIRARGCGHD